jgi:hypothetical protein
MKKDNRPASCDYVPTMPQKKQDLDDYEGTWFGRGEWSDL